ncbi:arsenate reductase (glutaredoxin) [Maritimibacter dapengensis]|uniref:Arsenate reductase n=1 Tax=Maritimibacter dapengensis TaxID=2836868 RepID=A0ABS6T0N2_9RHOB|nr:arsenate reductase (glutaredoxin) [Maritimibacter dapengensis]MBV7378786.1 arsenate reductase (glutaredoxin) [Maritimibacter dapengensis]
MSDVTIWHNPRCTKSRETLALLEGKGISPTVRKYLEDAPTEDEIRGALRALGLKAIDMMRPKEKEFKEAGLTRDSEEDLLIGAMVAMPKLIERPIVFRDGRARIGRPPETVLDLL